MTQTIGCGPLSVIDGPPPIPRRYGLIQAAAASVPGVRVVPDVDERGIERWLNGVEMQPAPAHIGATHQPYEDGSPATDKEVGETPQNPQFWPTTVYVSERCSAFRIPNDAVYRSRIMEKLNVVEGAHVARALLSGDGLPSSAPRLSDGEGDFPNGDTAVALSLALALLEGAIAAHNVGGVIHVSPIALTLLAGQGHIVEPDPLNMRGQDVIRTRNGTLVIPDAGYVDGASPATHATASSSQEWLYASGPIELRRGEAFINPPERAQALDRGMGATNGNTNTITYQAERHYLVAWDNTLQAAVRANRT